MSFSSAYEEGGHKNRRSRTLHILVDKIGAVSFKKPECCFRARQKRRYEVGGVAAGPGRLSSRRGPGRLACRNQRDPERQDGERRQRVERHVQERGEARVTQPAPERRRDATRHWLQGDLDASLLTGDKEHRVLPARSGTQFVGPTDTGEGTLSVRVG